MADKRHVDVSRLIALVKEKSLLWDVTAENYKLAELKPLAWKEIVDVLESDKFVFISFHYLYNCLLFSGSYFAVHYKYTVVRL